MSKNQGYYSIKEVEKRTGVGIATLRQWENRYQFPLPKRTPGGHRTYSEVDISAIKQIYKNIQNGMPTAKAIQHHIETSTLDLPRSSGVLSEELEKALLNLDTNLAEKVLSEAYGLHSFKAVILEVVVPAMQRIGEGWHKGQVTIAKEHLASVFIRGKLQEYFQLLGSGLDPAVVVSTLPGEPHEMGALITAIFLRRRGIKTYYLGPNMPLDDLKSFSEKVLAKAVVLSVTQKACVETLPKDALKSLAEIVIVGGSVFMGQTKMSADQLGAQFLGNDPEVVADKLVQMISDNQK